MERSQEEEVINAATHFIASIGSLLAAFLVLFLKDLHPRLTVPIILISSCSAWTFFSSYLYHSSKNKLDHFRNRVVDKTAIYLMISGSGCALSLVVSNPYFGMISCFTILIFSSFFIAKLCTQKEMSESASIASYVLLGWLSFMPATGLLFKTPITEGASFTLGIIGSLFYSIGVVFYVSDTRKWFHTIWHILVMAGFGFHFTALVIVDIS